MVTRGQLLSEVWEEHKDALTIMALKELANVSVNIHWNDRPDVSEGLVVESNFTLAPLSAMTDKRVRSALKGAANPVLQNGSWHIILKKPSSASGSAGAPQPRLRSLPRRSQRDPALPAPPPRYVPRRDAPSRSRSPHRGPWMSDGDAPDAHDAPVARRDVRDAPAPRVMRPVPKWMLRAPARCPPQRALQAGAVKPCAASPAPWRRSTMS